jgi:hypothetical protein
MNNVHEDAPEIFETRWAMSYLRGPLTRNQIKQLMDPVKSGAPSPSLAKPTPITSSASTIARPVLDNAIRQLFVPIRSVAPAGASLLYQPMLFGSARVFFADTKTGAEEQRDITYLAEARDDVNWDNAQAIDLTESDMDTDAQTGAAFAELPKSAASAKSYDTWKKSLADTVFRREKLELLLSPATKSFSRPGESERDFRVRLAQSTREERDAMVEKLRQKYAPKIASIQERIRRAEQNVEKEKSQASQSKFGALLSAGASILGAMFGRKTISAANAGRIATAARAGGRAMKESQDVGRAEENVAALQQQLADLDAQFKQETDAMTARLDPSAESLETIILRPSKSNITVKAIALAWTPMWKHSDGAIMPAFE